MGVFDESFRELTWQARSAILRENLEAASRAHASIPGLQSAEYMVSKFGKRFEPSNESGGGLEIQKGGCFNNAWLLAQKNPTLTYVEGFAVPSDKDECHHHAWCVTRKGRVIDPSWRNPKGCTYVGIGFKTRYLKPLVKKYNRNTTMLDLSEEGHPFLAGVLSIEEAAEPGFYRKSQN